MEGAALAEQKRIDLAMVVAWHTAVFALNGYAGKLKGKSLADFLSGSSNVSARRSQFADAHAFFGRLRAQGVPIETKH